MAEEFTIGAASGMHTIFECPNCRETIDSSADFCRFCGAKVDHEAAVKAAALMARINSACSDASYMRSTALALPVFFVLRFIPIISMLGGLGFTALCFVLPVWAVIWWIRYHSIETMDADFNKAWKTAIIVGGVVAIVLVVLVIAPFLLVLFGAMQR